MFIPKITGHFELVINDWNELKTDYK